MVQNGYFAACAAAVSVSALNSVDLPTLGNPTIPHLNPIVSSTLRRHGASGKDVDARDKPGHDEKAAGLCAATAIALFEKPLRLHRKMHLVLERRVASRR